MDTVRKARVGFAIVKLRADNVDYYLMRLNSKWRDVNFIGGHEKPRDTGDLRKTAQREFWEEVPPVRAYSEFKLEPLTNVLNYGPVYSRSRGDQALYDVQFFLVEIFESPAKLVEALSSRSKNVWVKEAEFEVSEHFNLSGLAKFFKERIVGGLSAIPLSNAENLSTLKSYFDQYDGGQPEFAFR